MSVWKSVLVSRPVLGLNLTYHQHQPQSPLKRGQCNLYLIWIFLLKFMFMKGKILAMTSKLLKHFLTTLHPGKRPLASLADLEGGPTLPVSPCKCRRELQPRGEAVSRWIPLSFGISQTLGFFDCVWDRVLLKSS